MNEWKHLLPHSKGIITNITYYNRQKVVSERNAFVLRIHVCNTQAELTWSCMCFRRSDDPSLTLMENCRSMASSMHQSSPYIAVKASTSSACQQQYKTMVDSRLHSRPVGTNHTCACILRPSGLCPGLSGWASTRTNLDFIEARDSEW